MALHDQRRVHAGPAVMQIHRIADSLEEAQQALAQNWQRWLAYAGLKARYAAEGTA